MCVVFFLRLLFVADRVVSYSCLQATHKKHLVFFFSVFVQFISCALGWLFTVCIRIGVDFISWNAYVRMALVTAYTHRSTRSFSLCMVYCSKWTVEYFVRYDFLLLFYLMHSWIFFPIRSIQCGKGISIMVAKCANNWIQIRIRNHFMLPLHIEKKRAASRLSQSISKGSNLLQSIFRFALMKCSVQNGSNFLECLIIFLK